MESEDMAINFYHRMKAAVTGRLTRDERRRAEKAAAAASQPFYKGRDPVKVADSVENLFKSFAWEGNLAEAELFQSWPELVGETNAAASHPENLNAGVLTIRCKSTAWATQLRLMQGEILRRVQEKFGSLNVQSLKFIGPDAPSWKKGPLSVPGRGPRDTYG
jgi:predicted nucleic acid-binding Zn ribbon protein